MNIKRILLGSIQDFQLGKFQNSVVFRKHSERLQNVINYAVSQGYAKPDFDYLQKIDTYLISIESVLNKLDLFYLFAGLADRQFKCINIVNPLKYEATENGSLTWSNSGVAGNGTDAYLDTNFQANLDTSGSQKYVLNGASRGFLISDFSETWSGYEALVDSDSATGSSNIYNILSEVSANINSPASSLSWLDNDVFKQIGFVTISRNSNRIVNFYHNGTFIQSDTIGATSLASTNQTIFKAILETSPSVFETVFSKIGLGFYFMGAGLNSADITLLKTQTNLFYTSIGLTPIA
jgi:hypothetical protein